MATMYPILMDNFSATLAADFGDADDLDLGPDAYSAIKAAFENVISLIESDPIEDPGLLTPDVGDSGDQYELYLTVQQDGVSGPAEVIRVYGLDDTNATFPLVQRDMTGINGGDGLPFTTGAVVQARISSYLLNQLRFSARDEAVRDAEYKALGLYRAYWISENTVFVPEVSSFEHSYDITTTDSITITLGDISAEPAPPEFSGNVWSDYQLEVVFTMLAAGSAEFVAGSGVTVVSADPNRTLDTQYGRVTALWRPAALQWVLIPTVPLSA